MEWEKIFTKHVSDKGVISRLSEELLQLHYKRHTIQLKVVKELSRRFFKGDIQMANEHMKRYSIPFVTKKMKLNPSEIPLHTH